VAWACSTEARALSSAPWESLTWSWNLELSSSTITWPLRTRSFTSTSTRATVPESSLPMFTERVGSSVPSAETFRARSPRARGSVM
jgi:hypothetical protein